MNESNNRLLVEDERENDLCLMSPMKLGSKVDGFQRKGQAWFVATELQSDLVVEIDELKFHLHKFPLLSRSGRLNRLVFESRDTEKDHIKLMGLPGGPDIFELAAKFCYGMAIDLTASNVAALRAAAEYLEMTEDLEEGNLISKTEAFLSFVVLASWKDSITVLKSCELISPWAESLQIVRRCSESIAWKACTDPRGISWSFTAKNAAGRKNQSPVWSGVTNDLAKQIPQDWWFEDVSTLCMDHFAKVIAAIKVKGMRSDLMGAAISYYALKWIPGLSKEHGASEGENIMEQSFQLTTSSGQDDMPILHTKSQLLLETIVSILPPQKEAVSCSFLLHLLRVANMQNASASCKTDLEKRIGMQLENAQLSDLLIPAFTHTCETLYDIDLVQRIVEYFMQQAEVSVISPASLISSENAGYDLTKGQTTPYNPKMKVARLLDSYLAEVARDTNLSLAKFQALAESLPDYARISDDGLYRAIDTYLKAHPGLSEHERKRVCRVMDCQKLSSDACTHAAQNERLPLRSVVQVIFSEQLKLKNAMAVNPMPNDQVDSCRMNGGAGPRFSMSQFQSGCQKPPLNADEWIATRREIRAVKIDIQNIKDKFSELQRDYASIHQQLEKLTKTKNQSSWSSGWKKLGKLTASHIFHNKDDSDGHHSSEAPFTSDPGGVRKSRRWRNSIS
ncbi:hypothetical protein O6H91_20G047700 [Diphasiastrum complanatum]|uniref:Uncharacterized protein n=1 Tax=Diphasiastrum complanatum TaxID=34168 RepID=A0ACC2AQC9_DIPCM|nr:hypothetical protein O6H91_20G047700 [Diphasiastrum complanatum]